MSAIGPNRTNLNRIVEQLTTDKGNIAVDKLLEAVGPRFSGLLEAALKQEFADRTRVSARVVRAFLGLSEETLPSTSQRTRVSGVLAQYQAKTWTARAFQVGETANVLTSGGYLPKRMRGVIEAILPANEHFPSGCALVRSGELQFVVDASRLRR